MRRRGARAAAQPNSGIAASVAMNVPVNNHCRLLHATGDAHRLAHRPQHEITGEQQEEHQHAGRHRRRFVGFDREEPGQEADHRPRPGHQANIATSSARSAVLRSRPWPALRLSLWRSGLPVAGITTVTAG